MLNTRKTLGLIILLLGVVISVGLLSDNQSKKSGDPDKNFNPEDQNASLSYKQGNDGSFLRLPEKNTDDQNEEGDEDNDNLTKGFVDSYAIKLLESVDEGGGIESQENAIEGLENIDKTVDYPQFKEKDIKVVDNTSDEREIEYIEELDQTLWNNFEELKNENSVSALRGFLEDNNSEILDKFINTVPQHIDDLLKIEVPENWASYHLQMLNLWQKKLTMYKTMKNREDDPLKAYLAIQDLPIILQESGKLHSIINERYEELKNNVQT